MKKIKWIYFFIIIQINVHFSSIAQSIATGGFHTLAICNDSTVKAFGENASGQLGNGSTIDSNIPVAVSGLSGVIAVSGGGDQTSAHSMALKSDGSVWTWGSNQYGALGDGSFINSYVPMQVSGLSQVNAISAGGWHSVALKNDGTVWTWGFNSDGQLGDSTVINQSIPIQINGLSNIVAIAAGTYHTLALKNDGTVWAWGDNAYGQLGDGTSTDRLYPVQVSGLIGVIKLAAGRFFSLAVKSDGTVWTFGDNVYGQLGNGSTIGSNVPIQVTGLTGVTSAVTATGAFHCLAVKSDGSIWSWGRNSNGNLGINTTANSPVPVQMLSISSAVGVAAGFNFSVLYLSNGTLWGCGRNSSGQLGDGTFVQKNTVVQSTSMCSVLQPGISFTLPICITDVSARNHHTVNEVNWTACCNNNTEKFIIQHSLDGVEFADIGEMNNLTVENNSLSTRDYQFIHKNISIINYYRIKQEDIDGNYLLSKTVKVNVSMYQHVEIYPNPVSSQFFIRSISDHAFYVQISDAVGHVIYRNHHPNANQPISSTSWQKGVYFVTVFYRDFRESFKIEK